MNLALHIFRALPELDLTRLFCRPVRHASVTLVEVHPRDEDTVRGTLPLALSGGPAVGPSVPSANHLREGAHRGKGDGDIQVELAQDRINFARVG